jgi:fumarylacetoacetate (FAA) hydrolase
MKLVSYIKEGHEQLAFLVHDLFFNADEVHPELPSTMSMFLNYWDDYFPLAQALNQSIVEGRISTAKGIEPDFDYIIAPVPQPASCRDAYAFRQHVAAARKNRSAEMIPAFDQFPVFYFTNHHSVRGPGPVHLMPDHFQKLDFELECAVVICRQGRNIPASAADAYIGGYMIMNDLSARLLQAEEMQLNLGPAKGKDFATVIGPWLVTPDELEPYKTSPKEGHVGNSYNLAMRCRVNGVQVSEGNLADMDWTFAEIIERCAYGADLFPGDIIGSGTVGTGCFLELNGTGKRNDPAYAEQWLREGDVVEMDIDGLGTLTNTMLAEESEFSILAKKKNL